MNASAPQPPPVPNDNDPIVSMVVCDLLARARLGREKYGTVLQAGNGRVALVDLYQELLDAAQYVRQEIEERDSTCACDGQEIVARDGVGNEWHICGQCARAYRYGVLAIGP